MADEPGTGKSDTPSGDLLAGKYKDVSELEKAYKELESKLGELGNERSELAAFIEKVAPYFVVNPTTGEVGFNEEAIKKTLGFDTEDKPKNTDTPEDRKKDRQGDDMSGIDIEAKIQEGIQKALKAVLEEKINPLAERIDRKEAEEWIESLKGKYSDFEEYQDDILKEIRDNRLNIKSSKQLEKIYAAVKHEKGGFVDKREVERENKNLLAMLEKTGTVPIPGASFQTKSPDEVEGRDLLGLEDDFGKDIKPDNIVAKSLLGKSKAMLSPD